MKIKKIEEVEIEVESYTYKDVTIYFENDYFLKESKSLAEKIAIILQREEEHTGSLTYLLYDFERLYSIDSTDDIFDIFDDPEKWCCRYIGKIEGIEVFLADEYGVADLAYKLCDPLNSEKLCGEIIEEILVQENAILMDGTVLKIGK